MIAGFVVKIRSFWKRQYFSENRWRTAGNLFIWGEKDLAPRQRRKGG